MSRVLAIGRSATGQRHQKLREQQLGRAMIRVARDGAPKQVLEAEDINAI